MVEREEAERESEKRITKQREGESRSQREIQDPQEGG